MKSDTKLLLLSFVFSSVPYLLVAWGYTAFTNGDAKDFCLALAVLLGIRLFFSVIETLGGVLAWRVYGKRASVQATLQAFRDRNFPKRKFREEDFGEYLECLLFEGEDRSLPPETRESLKEFQWSLRAMEQHGILVGRRAKSAADAAFDIYSPKEDAPPFALAERQAATPAEEVLGGLFD